MKPVLSNLTDLYICVVDLIHFLTNPDGNYKFLIEFQDHLTKFNSRRENQLWNRQQPISHYPEVKGFSNVHVDQNVCTGANEEKNGRQSNSRCHTSAICDITNNSNF